MLFSKRNGYLPAKKAIQRESLDEETRNGLWNVILLLFCNRVIVAQGKLIYIYKTIWTDFFKQAADTVPTHPTCTYNTPDERKFFMAYREFFCVNARWFECFDFLEFVVKYVESQRLVAYQFNAGAEEPSFFDIITSHANKVLEEESSAYRFVGNCIVEITSETELREIDEAMDQSSDPVQEHLKKALNFLADRTSPDYQNSVKESISAVESLCCAISAKPKASLGDALQLVDKKYPLHGALKEAFKKLYGYTSDAGGIRHGGIDFADVDYDLAKYMLVSCSAFINYLISKSN